MARVLGTGRDQVGRRTRRGVIAAAVTALLAAGCGGGGGATATTRPTADPVTSTSTPVVTGPAGRVRSDPCQPEIRDDGATRLLVGCGPATATLTVGGRAMRFEGGSCVRGERSLTVHIGRQALTGDGGAADQWFFGMVAGDISAVVDKLDPSLREGLTFTPLTGDGAFDGDVIVTWALGGESGALRHPKITFADGVTRATFSGEELFGEHGPVRGRVTCKAS